MKTRRVTPSCILVAIAIVGSAALVAPAASQAIEGCSGCTIAIERILTIGNDDGAALGGPPSAVFRDSAARYWVAPVGDASLVFDSAGEFITRVGKVSGPYDSDLADPESFVMAGAFFQAADSVGVVDIGLPRVKIIGPELTVRREVTLPGIVRAVHVVDWPTNVIVVGALRGPDSVGWPLHRLDLSGKRARVLQSFGDNGGELRLGQSSLVNDRRISVAHSGDLWAAEVLAYRLHLFAESGSARRSLAHDRDWFTSTGVRHSTSPPGEYIDGIAVDELEQVWVFARVRSPNWQNADGTRKDDQADVWHSRIEVLDSEGSGVLASTEVDGLVLYVAGNDILAMYERDNATGRHLVHLVRFALTPSS